MTAKMEKGIQMLLSVTAHDDSQIELKKEIPDYLSVANISPAIDLIAWRKNKEYRLPNWSRACTYK